MPQRGGIRICCCSMTSAMITCACLTSLAIIVHSVMTRLFHGELSNSTVIRDYLAGATCSGVPLLLTNVISLIWAYRVRKFGFVFCHLIFSIVLAFLAFCIEGLAIWRTVQYSLEPVDPIEEMYKPFADERAKERRMAGLMTMPLLMVMVIYIAEMVIFCYSATRIVALYRVHQAKQQQPTLQQLQHDS